MRPLVFLALLVASGVAVLAEERAAPTMPLLQQAVPLSAAVQAAQDVGVPTSGIQLLETDSILALNDEVSFLATVAEKNELRQWVILLRAQHVTEDENRQFPGMEQVLYTNLAEAPVVFPAEPIGGIAIRTLGPYRSTPGSKKAKDIWSGALVRPQFLRTGLIAPSYIMGRMQQLQAQGQIAFSASPLAADVVAQGIVQREQVGLTDEDVRRFAAFSPAFLNFFALANQTEGINTIVREMIDVPWLSLALNGGQFKDIHFNLVEPLIDMPPQYWGLPAGTPVRTLGIVLTLNGKPALNLVMALTEPRPPLLNCAGLVGLVAVRPDGKGPKLTLSLLAAKPATERTPTGIRPGSR